MIASTVVVALMIHVRNVTFRSWAIALDGTRRLMTTNLILISEKNVHVTLYKNCVCARSRRRWWLQRYKAATSTLCRRWLVQLEDNWRHWVHPMASHCLPSHLLQVDSSTCMFGVAFSSQHIVNTTNTEKSWLLSVKRDSQIIIICYLSGS